VKNAAPEGYSSVSPYLTVDSVEKELEFLQAVFGAESKQQLHNARGDIWHAEARIGDTIVMLERVRKDSPASQSMLYLWTDDVDAAYQRALKNEAVSVQEPGDQFYGNREAGIKDPQGNTWWIAREIQKLSNQEIERRLAEQRKQRL
jgi:uncharacterized glyoxalase superfamily protein PhnB